MNSPRCVLSWVWAILTLSKILSWGTSVPLSPFSLEVYDMATNHTKELSITDALAAGFLWKHKKRTNVSAAVVSKMAEEGIISMSNLLERVLLDNSKLVHSNKKGEDFTDKSDAKYITARLKKHSVQKCNGRIVYRNFATLQPGALQTKRGVLRVMITYHNSATDYHNFLMFRLPYNVWKKAMCKTGLHFYFSCDTDGLTDKTKNWAGKYKVATVKELAA